MWRSWRGWNNILYADQHIIIGTPDVARELTQLGLIVPAPSGRKFRLADGVTLEQAQAIVTVLHS
jgi:hypothetical protein